MLCNMCGVVTELFIPAARCPWAVSACWSQELAQLAQGTPLAKVRNCERHIDTQLFGQLPGLLSAQLSLLAHQRSSARFVTSVPAGQQVTCCFEVLAAN